MLWYSMRAMQARHIRNKCLLYSYMTWQIVSIFVSHFAMRMHCASSSSSGWFCESFGERSSIRSTLAESESNAPWMRRVLKLSALIRPSLEIWTCLRIQAERKINYMLLANCVIKLLTNAPLIFTSAKSTGLWMRRHTDHVQWEKQL